MQNEEKDPAIWEVAKRRASFKGHLGVYIVMSIFFWTIWFMNRDSYSYNGFPWPVWPMFGWGIGLLFHFMGAYIFPKEGSAEREYQRMIKNK